MECRELRSYLREADWKTEELPTPYREHLVDCKACGEFYESLQAVDRAELLRVTAPEGLEDRVMEELLRDRPSRQRYRSFAGSGDSVAGARSWIHLAAAAVLLVVVSVSLTLGFTKGNGSDLVIVHLYLAAPDAEKVAVVGDWNGWDAGSDMLRDDDGDGVWEIRLEVARGQEYRYQFLIDGDTWIADPSAPLKVDDGFGGTNSILDI